MRNNQEKARLMQVRQDAGLTTKQVADQAGLPLRDVYAAEIGIPVDEEVALKILMALSLLTGRIHVRDNTEIWIKEPEKWRAVRKAEQI
jgi:hypothetical protein